MATGHVIACFEDGNIYAPTYLEALVPHLANCGMPGVRLHAAFRLDEATNALTAGRCAHGKAEALIYWRPTHGHENDAWDEKGKDETFIKDKVFHAVRDEFGIFVHVHGAGPVVAGDGETAPAAGVTAKIAVDDVANEALRERVRAYAADVSKKPMAPAGMAG